MTVLYVVIQSMYTVHGEEEILRKIEIARSCMKSLTKNIWRSSITQSVKIRLYNTYVLPVLLYGSEMWDVTVKSGKRLDAFDHCTKFGQLTVSKIIKIVAIR